MKSIEFIKSFINAIVIDFPSIRCTYGYDNLDNTHTIEIIPSSFLDNNLDFSDIEDSFYEDFFRLFPNEIAYIITNNSIFPVTNPIYVSQGLSYSSSIISDMVNIQNDVKIFFNSLNIASNNKLQFNPINVKDNNGVNIDFQNFININEFLANNVPSNAGENNYALAA